MTDRAQALILEALTLSLDERAEIAAELLASLDDSREDPAAVLAAWAKEIERRGRRALASELSGEPWEDVRSRVARRLAQR
ncbi:MAG TPA: addiction module protein [Thermoanaerobaculia bacterium]|jgi:putative addiction module component (TIGR02574 family)|nr:addiction module protein [Thermoanaerobaculia bacterium]